MIANLIVVEQASHFNIEIKFFQHAIVGIPVTLVSLVILLGWFLIA
jgi:Na+/H+ antiporter NhaD/arsenite permease-like protein